MNDNRLKLIFVFLIKLIKLGLASVIYCTDFESEFYFELRTIFSLSLSHSYLTVAQNHSLTLSQQNTHFSLTLPARHEHTLLSLSLSFVYLSRGKGEQV